jgi:sigma-E factor negative regulatory protein RseA
MAASAATKKRYESMPTEAKPPETKRDGSVVNESERDSQLSAMFDGALPAAECELLARRLSRDPVLKQQWSRYALIGAAMRGEPLGARRPTRATGALHGVLAERVAHALVAEQAQGDGASQDGDMAAPAPVRRPERASRWARPAAGVAIAASVAALAVFWVQRDGDVAPATASTASSVPASGPLAAGVAPARAPQVADGATGGGEVVLAASDTASQRNSREPESYVVPMPGQRTSLASSAQLANYVVAHSEYSAPLTRRSLLSALMATEVAEAGPAPAASTTPSGTPPAEVVPASQGPQR